MAVKDNDRLSVNAYAKTIGVNEKAVRNAIRDGKIKKGFDPVGKKIIKRIADKEYGYLHLIPHRKKGVTKDKLIDQIEAQEKDEKPVRNSDKSEPKLKKLPSPKELAEKSEQIEQDLDASEYDESYEDLLKKLPIHSKLTHREALLRREIIAAALDKKKLEEIEGILVRRAEVEKVLFAFGSTLKKALMTIPARVVDHVLAAPDKVEAINILNEELVSVLETYANTGNIDFNIIKR